MALLETMEDAEREALRRLAEHAEDLRFKLEETLHEVLPGNHSPAETVLLAHLMTASDGYNHVTFVEDWSKRSQTGWVTTLGYLVELDRDLTVSFAFEIRYRDHVRQLAITIDWNRPGVRLPEKLQRENGLMARGIRVVSFTELEILANPEACRERVESVLVDLVDEVLVDGGAIRGPAEAE